MVTKNKIKFNLLREKPINPQREIKNLMSSYQKVKIDKNCDFYCEELVDIKNLGIAGLNYYNTSLNPPYYQSIPGSIPDLKLRKTVAKKLLKINNKLKKINLEIFVFDAYRPLSVQNYFYYKWVPRYLRSLYPNKDEVWIKRKVKTYWAKGVKNKEELFSSIPPHSTGAAIDLTICFKDSGRLLEMGSIFDDTTKKSQSEYYEKNGDIKSFTDIEATKNRRLLYHLMTSEGFAYHPKEWWHFSYGDQVWALITNKLKAIYGYAGDEY